MAWISNGLKSLFKGTSNSEEITTSSGDRITIYHEKQIKELCALHALNNLFQENFYTKTTLDKICIDLSPDDLINPHKSILGRGNYNINVVMKAVQLKDYEAIWFDKRKPTSTLNLHNIKGFIMNVPSDYKVAGLIGLPWETKHWYAITLINKVYYDLDSKSNVAKLIGDEDKLREYLASQLKAQNKELFVIVKKEVAETESWKLTSENIF